MIIISALGITAICGAIVGWIGRLPLFAITAFAIALFTAGAAIATGRGPLAAAGLFLVALVASQVGYFVGLLLKASLRRGAIVHEAGADSKKQTEGPMIKRPGATHPRG